MKKLKIFEAVGTVGTIEYYRGWSDIIPTGLKKSGKKYAGFEKSNIYVDEKGKEILATFLYNGKMGLIFLISEYIHKAIKKDSRIKEFFDDFAKEADR